ncbi:6132_t:CDS:2 [Paraglomus occultum]|uniref:6132_t:CDS:1 n=1 Tax=Paraglomus occultum TaxID=144539 RepID=A0A9N9FB46_9GLOM|nr:6132_t:CDS:2 [Paraglomus occultum]
MKETSQRFPQRSFTLPVMIPDDNISGIPTPPKNVDYLSYEWKENELETSWKVMSKQKNEHANGIRLENASWRTWAKQKYHLRTVNPSKLNWLKDSDVTWLYGPLHTAHSPILEESSPKSTQDKFLMGCKSCLKKKSISEVFRFNPRPRPRLNSCSSDTQLYQKESDDSSNSQEYHIRFNNKVEQYMAVDEEESDDEMIEDNGSESGSNSDDSAIVMKISRSPRRRTNICKLEPTTLKSDRIADNQYSALYSRRNSKRSSRHSSSSGSTTAAASSYSANSCLSSSPHSTTSLPYPTYSNSCCSWVDDLDVDDYTGFGVFAPDVFEDFDPSQSERSRVHDPEFDGVGLVDRAVHIASNVKDIVHWCSSMVFNGQVF